ncbi:PKD domain protein [Owenweeksia hongkongensis DSM 17368]|uniref:PKD domain protein n=2 Tax=Owenweeksia TaxID=267986 RepID=G8QZY8_OWEHD|nr:T9SS type A sorting domain-containing protein [Owenweeksia hongkongensis]AEV32628.1 PKD domain protein [Owenweeksia hongkongensis DSM 17368]
MKRILLLFSIISCWITGYAQQAYTFGTGGATGQFGPSQSDITTAYTGTSLAGQVTSNAGVQYWVVPQSGYYSIQALGAQGGGVSGGKGASVTGEFSLLGGDTLFIIVGQEGIDGMDGSASGGGGSFVTIKDPTSTTITSTGKKVTPLVIAGGGGGNPGTAHADSDGSAGTAGKDGVGANGGGTGGMNGNGGGIAVPNGNNRGGAGGGFLTDGDMTGTCGTGGAESGLSFLNGGVGGLSVNCSTPYAGGFGGGGGAISSGWRGSGGGGGYSGGAGGQTNTVATTHRGGGGGSYSSGNNPVTVSGFQTGDGMVVISPLSTGSANDVGVTSIDAPTNFCAGTSNVLVTIQNYGVNQVTSATVNWSVNGVAQTPYSFTGTLDTTGGSGSVSAQIILGSYAFASATPYNFVVWTDSPNGQTDTVNGNDTINKVLQTGLIQPNNFAAGNIQATSADLTWNTVGASNFRVTYGTAGFNPLTGGTTNPATTGALTITGLSANTAYEAYIVSACPTGSVYSDTTGPISFRTPCVVATAPFNENFDSTSSWFASGSNTNNTIDPCWSSLPDVSQGAEPFKWIPRGTGPTSGNGPLQDLTGGNFMYAEASGSSANDEAFLTTPPIDVSGLTTPGLYFFQHRYSGATIADMEVLVSNDFGTTWTSEYSVTGDIQTSSSDPWSLEFVNLANYTGDTVMIQFKQTGNGCCGDAAIDSVVVDEAPTCPWPTGFAMTGRSDSSVVMSWNDPTGSTWDLQWGPPGFTQASPGAGTQSTTTNPDTIHGLQSNTDYEVYVRTDCGPNGTSIWIGPILVRTACSPYTAPYSDNFDNYPSNITPYCWNLAQTGGRTTVGQAYTYTFGTPNSAPNHIYFYNGNPAGPNDTTLFISPRFSDMVASDKRIQFNAKASFGTNTIVVGSMGDPMDMTSFNPIDTLSLTATYSLFVVAFDAASGYNGTDQYVAFRHGNGGTFTLIYIDDFVYEQIPACNPPLVNTLGLAGASTTTANIYWGSGSDGNETHWEVGPVGFTPGTTSFISTDSVAGNVDTTMITGLSAQTCYEFYIRDSCASNGFSPWIGPYQFCTPCVAQSMPYYESFDAVTPTCWDSVGGQWFWNLFVTGTTDNYAEANFWGQSSGQAVLTSPPISITQDAQVRFDWSHLYSTSYPDDELMVRASVVGSGVWDTILSLKGPNNFNDPSAGNSNTPGTFITEEVLLNPLVYTGNDVIVEMRAITDFGPDLFINDFYVEDAPSCPKLIGLNAVGVTDTSAMFDWVQAPSAQSYEVWYGPQGFYQGTATIGGSKVATTGDSLTVDTLSSNTCYEFVVRSVCTPGDTSQWTGPYVFCTDCSPFTASYYTGFDNMTTTETPECWTPYFVGGTGNFAVFEVYSPGTPQTSPNHVRFYNYNQDTTMGISPQFIDLTAGDKRIRFDAMVTTTLSPNSIIVGTVSDPSAGNTFSPIDTIAITNTYTEYISDITVANGYNGTDNYIALMHGNNATFRTYYIDEFNYEVIPTCLRPNSLTASGITVNSATLGWSPHAASTGNTFEVSYGVNLSSPGAGTKQTVTGTSVALTTLMSSSKYCFYVREMCSATDSSFWEGPYCFNTPCVTVMAPISEDFENHTLGFYEGEDNCWTLQNTVVKTSATSGFGWDLRNVVQATSGTSTGASGDNTLYPAIGGQFFNADVSYGTSGDSSMLISPVVDISQLNAPELEYHLHRMGTQMGDFYVDVYDGTNWINGVHAYTSSSGIQTSQSAAYLDTVIDLAPYIGTTNFRARFRVVSNGCCAGDNSLDDISIYDAMPSACTPVTNVAANVIACDSIEITWNGSNDSTVVGYGPTGAMPTMGTLILNDSTHYITGTMPNTSYDVYVANVCDGDTSAVTGPITFNTGTTGAPVAAFTGVPAGAGSLMYDFDASASTGNGNVYTWNFGDGSLDTGMIVSNIYTTGGSYTVTLVVTNACGSDTLEITYADVSLGENVLSQNLKLYPNPATDVLNVELNLEGNSEVSVRILDMSGKQVLAVSKEKKDKLMTESIDISSLAKGVYMIEVSTEQVKTVRRLVKE